MDLLGIGSILTADDILVVSIRGVSGKPKGPYQTAEP